MKIAGMEVIASEECPENVIWVGHMEPEKAQLVDGALIITRKFVRGGSIHLEAPRCDP